MNCPNCKTPLPDFAPFCTHCGMEIGATPAKAKKTQLTDKPTRGSTAILMSKGICMVCSESFKLEELTTIDGKPVCHSCLKQVEEHKAKNDMSQQMNETAYLSMLGTDLYKHRRKNERFTVSSAMAHAQAHGMKARIRGHHQEWTGPILNLSRAGMQWLAKIEIGTDEQLTIDLHLPAYRGSLTLEGVVRWVEEVDESERRVGVQFTQIPDDVAKHLRAMEKYPALRNAGDRKL